MEAKQYQSHGDGSFRLSDLKRVGKNVVIEKGVLVFHPENISLGNNVYIGHNTILKGYYKNEMIIEDNCWIGQNCFLHAAGGIKVEKNVGIGPGVTILSSQHSLEQVRGPILFQPIVFGEIIIREGCDIGANSTILAGVEIGQQTQVGAMSLVNRSIENFKIAFGVPCKAVKDLTLA
jgi:acetyltransferase-like isoleucine patch superfamily enzyme